MGTTTASSASVSGLQAWLGDVRAALRPALCVHDVPSANVERHTAPKVEVRSSSEFLLTPVTVAGAKQSCSCLIERSINSTRISFALSSSDHLEEQLLHSFLRFAVHR